MVKHRQTAKVKQTSKSEAISPIWQKEVIIAIVGVVGTAIGVIGTILIAIINNPPQPTTTPVVITVTETSLPPPTATYETSSDCPQDMAYIPEGFFWLGSENDLAFEDETPQRRIFLNAYCMDLTEVDNKEYNKFLA